MLQKRLDDERVETSWTDNLNLNGLMVSYDV